ncbi:MAG: DUF4388 domain-containing protein [Deltaproteobacteria bacterium]|nr:DUF4388 domain-containing protein [Deltaproteobacteria bacterium]
MSEFIRVEARGAVIPENEAAQARLAERAGRFYLAPTSPDILLGVRAPCVGGKAGTPRVVLAGDLSGVQLADLVAFLNQSRITGILRVVSPAGERAIVFKTGEVHGAASDDPADRIGEIAVRLGLVQRAQLERVLGANPPPGRVGRALVEAGHLQPHDLWRCLQHQVSEVFHAILLCTEGAFMLVDGPVEDRGALAINTQGLLMDAIRRIDEMKEFRKRLPSSRAFVARVKPAGPNLEPAERAVYEQCSGDRTVAEVAQAMKLTEFDATKVLHHLITSGYVAASPGPQSSAVVAKEPTAGEIVRVFNFVFREILSEVRKLNMATELVAAANGALTQQAERSPMLKGLAFGPDGALRDGVLENLARLQLPPAEAARALHASLSELMFFLLFEAGELLDQASDEDLARRVKQLLASIEGAS